MTTDWTLYAVLLILLIASYIGHKKLHSIILQLETFVKAHLPAPQAAAVDTMLGTFDTITSEPPQQSVSDMLAVLKQLTEFGVVNANIKTVTQAKTAGLFNDALAASVKSDVVQSVVQDLGPLKATLEAHVGAVEPIIEKAVEFYVDAAKK